MLVRSDRPKAWAAVLIISLLGVKRIMAEARELERDGSTEFTAKPSEEDLFVCITTNFRRITLIRLRRALRTGTVRFVDQPIPNLRVDCIMPASYSHLVRYSHIPIK